ncbi:tRNA methyltransferase 11 [Lunasporangiospora selenospora]|uniref:tRNA methyltransferase 11 n=1 Tax=Lunasporangiospora selenospora TaxID=979761 RepID=A0A9P6KBM8_9FUNG|nr:tRNA methyltransferase 11 [Lunasporangiospora selenospora]
MTEVVADLLMFAVKYLVKGGRLVYWLPTVTEDYSIDDLPTHPCMELVANCEQAFGQWSRRLITMEKVADWDGEVIKLGPPTGEMNTSKTVPSQAGHFGFRDRYFAFSAVENARRKKELKEAYQAGGREGVAAYMKSLEEKKKVERESMLETGNQ